MIDDYETRDGCAGILLALFISLLFWGGLLIVYKAHAHGTAVTPPTQCRGEFGHKRPQSFCDRRDNEQIHRTTDSHTP